MGTRVPQPRRGINSDSAPTAAGQLPREETSVMKTAPTAPGPARAEKSVIGFASCRQNARFRAGSPSADGDPADTASFSARTNGSMDLNE